MSTGPKAGPAGRRRAPRGFTLIELVVAMAIVAILAMIAIPGYQQYVRKGRRSEAIAVLLELQLRQEKFRANNPAYGTATDISAPTTGAAATYYTFSVSGNSGTAYTLQAAAKTTGGQNQDQQNGTACSTLTLDQSGDRSPAACWR